MDIIKIEKLEVFAYHGALKEEKIIGQKFYISAMLHLDLRGAGKSDNLERTVNYADVCTDITRLMQENTYDLIETCAEVIALYILENYALVKKVDIIVEKPSAPVKETLRNISVHITRQWHEVYLALGANMGDTKATLQSAIDDLQGPHLVLLKTSSYYKTKPMSDVVQEDFLNAVIKCKTTLSPRELITHILAVEASLGRIRDVMHGPRTIDIDVLLYEDVLSHDNTIAIPHPRMAERLFVLVPLCDISPHLVHPILNKTIATIRHELEREQGDQVYEFLH